MEKPSGIKWDLNRKLKYVEFTTLDERPVSFALIPRIPVKKEILYLAEFLLRTNPTYLAWKKDT